MLTPPQAAGIADPRSPWHRYSRTGLVTSSSSTRGLVQNMVSGLGAEHVPGGPWDRFSKYNAVALEREDGAILAVRAHAGELVPGSTEDLLDFLGSCGGHYPTAPFTLELDPT